MGAAAEIRSRLPALVVGEGGRRGLLLQAIASVGLIVASALTVGPIGTSGRGLAVLVLLVVNCAGLGVRLLPVRAMSERTSAVILLATAAAAAALLSLTTTGTASIFPFFVAGGAGYRLSLPRAVWVALACSVLNGGVLALHIGPGYRFTPWYIGAASGAAALVGMMNRTREDAVQAQLDTAVARERAAQAEAREAVLAERGRIARDVHDLLAHSLAGIGMQLELADALLEKGDTQKLQATVQRAHNMVRESLVEAQRTVRALREDSLPLVETIAAMMHGSGYETDPVVNGAVRTIDTTAAQALVRVAQESLTNAQRYAPGAAVHVEIAYRPAEVALEIVNDAASVPVGPVRGSSGMGLVGMRERITLLHGRVTTGPTAAGGWRVVAEVPA